MSRKQTGGWWMTRTGRRRMLIRRCSWIEWTLCRAGWRLLPASRSYCVGTVLGAACSCALMLENGLVYVIWQDSRKVAVSSLLLLIGHVVAECHRLGQLRPTQKS